MNDLEPLAKSLRTLMLRLEQLLVILHEHRITYWPDWGTLLGIVRHKNVIPWDYDVDLCLPAADYQKLIDVFERAGGQIGELVLQKDYYDDPPGAFAILFADVPDASLGIDIVAYNRAGDRLLNAMSPTLQADYPGNYDFPVAQVLPLRWGQFLGQPVLMPQQPIARLVDLFGDWQAFPDGQTASALTSAPFVEVPDQPNARGPWITRAQRPEPGDAWLQPGYVAGTQVVRWLAQADADGTGATPELLCESTFTELVYWQDRALWGKVWIGTLFPGDRFVCDVPGLSAQGPCFGRTAPT